jgi:hypothetical protein
MNTARVLAIIRLQVLYLLVGHWLPSLMSGHIF